MHEPDDGEPQVTVACEIQEPVVKILSANVRSTVSGLLIPRL